MSDGAAGAPGAPPATTGDDAVVVFVSDVHMAPAGRPARDARHLLCEVDQFAAFLAHVTREHGAALHLVFLGDVLDISAAATRSGPDAVRAELESIIDRHEPVFLALRELLGVGGRLTVVSGNHDIDLVRPAIFAPLCAAVSGGDAALGERVAFTPWIVNQEGLFFAEHGSQHHDIHHSASVAAPLLGDPGAPADTSAMAPTPLVTLSAVRRWLQHPWRPDGLRLHLGWAVAGGARRQRARYLRDGLAAHSRATGLDVATLAQLDDAATTSWPALWWRIGRVLVRRGVGRVVGRREPARSSDVLLRAWPNVVTVLGDRSPVPFVVFGHCHVAALRHDDGRRTTYLNCGTWVGTDHDFDGVAPRRTAVRIRQGSAGTTAELLRWEGDAVSVVAEHRSS